MPTGRERLVFPLDVGDLAAARRWLRDLADAVGVFKVGLELFTAVGPDAVRAVHDAGAACFLDLKLHDIPATMRHAVRSAAALGVRFLTVHTAAGPAALRACVEEAAARPGLQLLGVTVLTSLDAEDLRAVGLAGPPDSAVVRLARLGRDAGLRGFVCSPAECAPLRASLGPRAALVVPGVRPAGSASDDQRRTATPGDAVRAGADLLVVGRPIREAADPVAAARAIAAEVEAAEAERAGAPGNDP